jgi:hypothetical protein
MAVEDAVAKMACPSRVKPTCQAKLLAEDWSSYELSSRWRLGIISQAFEVKLRAITDSV